MKILALLKDVCGDEHERIAWHAKLPHKRLIDLSRHATDRLLLTEQPGEEDGRLAELRLAHGWFVNVKDEIEVLRDLRELVKGAPITTDKRSSHLGFE